MPLAGALDELAVRFPDIAWHVVLLSCPRDVAEQRIRARAFRFGTSGGAGGGRERSPRQCGSRSCRIRLPTRIGFRRDRAAAVPDDEEYYVRKRGKSKSRIPAAVAPPVEDFERLRVRDRAPSQPQPPVPPPMPLGVRYGPAMDMEGFAFRRGKGDVGKKGKKGRNNKSAPVSEESESEDEEVRVKHVKRPRSKSKTRRREIEEEDEEEEVYKEKKKGGKRAKGKKEKRSK